MVGNTYFRSEFIKVGKVQRRFAVLVSCFSYFFCYILLEVLTQLYPPIGHKTRYVVLEKQGREKRRGYIKQRKT